MRLVWGINLSARCRPLPTLASRSRWRQVSKEKLLEIINKNFDLRPGVIVRDLDLKKPIYHQTAAYGHFGRDIFPWEKPKTLAL